MPISALELAATLKFSLTKAVADWPDIEQGENEVTLSLDGVDIDEWNQAYAAVLVIAAAGSTTVDLTSFTNLATESVTFVKVLAIIISVAATVEADADGVLLVEGGAANPFAGFFSSDTEGLSLAVGTGTVIMGNADFAGWTVDGTNKNIKFENTGADSITVTVAIVGATA